MIAEFTLTNNPVQAETARPQYYRNYNQPEFPGGAAGLKAYLDKNLPMKKHGLS